MTFTSFIPLDVTLETLNAQLYPDEQIQLYQDSVGLYDGKDKHPLYSSGRLHLTSHRLIFISHDQPHQRSNYLHLERVRQSEYWSGLWKSSPKISLLLSSTTTTTSTLTTLNSTDDNETIKSNKVGMTTLVGGNSYNWICRICGMNNVPSLQLGRKCSLCGVEKDTSQSTSSRITPPIPPLPPSVPTSIVEPSTTSTTTSTTTTISTKGGIGGISCPICTYLNHHSMSRCEMCDTPLPSLNNHRSTTNSSSSLNNTPTTARPSTPSTSSLLPTTSFNSSYHNNSSTSLSTLGGTGGEQQASEYVRLSFRKGGDKKFYEELKRVLKEKRWEFYSENRGGASLDRGNNGSVAKKSKGKGAAGGEIGREGEGEESSKGKVGIDAIMRGIDLTSQSRETSLEEALKDLQSLMNKAKEMIALAQTINSQLASQQQTSSSSSSSSSSSPESILAAQSLAKSSLTSLGLTSAVVMEDQTRSTIEYHQSLAKELSQLLNKPLSDNTTKGGGGGGGRGKSLIESKGGIMGLDEVWCVWNRARGVALVSPKSLLLSTPYLSQYTRNLPSTERRLDVLTFRNGMTILHTERYNVEVVEERFLGWIDGAQGLNEGENEAKEEDKEEEENEEGEKERRGLKGISLLELTNREQLSIGLTKSLIELVELGPNPSPPSSSTRTKNGFDGKSGGGGGGKVVRDEQSGGDGIRWYRNYIVGFEWDGQD